MKTVILDTDGSLIRQRLHELFLADTIDLSGLRGNLQFYADKQGIKECAGKIKPYTSGPPVSYLLGAGDFHHLTLLILEQIQTPFVLIVFDNHTDCSFPYPRYHCGNWMYHAARLTKCKKIMHIGATEGTGLLNRFVFSLTGKGYMSMLSGQECNLLNYMDNFMEAADAVFAENYPVYVSIDKDVLRRDESPSDWDNGVMSMKEMSKILEYIVSNSAVAGADITGEMNGRFHYRYKPLKNLLSSIEHHLLTDREPCLDSDIKHRLINYEILDILGARRVAS